jgi:zinc transport system substrate-binding protein
MVVLDRVAKRLEPRDAVTQVDPLHQSFLGQDVQHPVDACQPDPLAARDQLAMDLLRADAAVLRVEEIDHTRTRQAAPIPRLAELGKGLLGPGRAHTKMVTVIVTTAMRIVPVCIAVALLVAGCGAASGAKGKTSAIAAFYPLAFVAERVGGTGVDVHNLTPPGAEPHDIELTPRDVGRLQEADVVLYLSHGFQPAVEQAVSGAHGKRVDVLAGLDLRRGVGDEAGKSDPHVWLDPVLFARIVRRIGIVFGHPGRAGALERQVLALDGGYRRGLAHCAHRDFVTSHAAFGYLAARYHLHQIPITGIDPESEPSPQRLRDLIALVRREHVTTVFFERLVSPRLAETVARDAGAKAAVLDPIEGLTPDEQEHGDTYLTLMRKNLQELRSALGCR